MNNKRTWEDSLKTRSSLTFSALENQDAKDLFLLSPSDTGVMRNGGKRGSRFAPDALIHLFSKMVATKRARNWSSKSISDDRFEAADFNSAQAQATAMAKAAMQERSTPLNKLIHIGGGHDHVYPLAKAWAQLKSERDLIIVNIDAHLDSRADEFSHSGTPFRQLSNELGKRLYVYQIGIHSYANVQANYVDMPNMVVAPPRDQKNPADWLIEMLSQHESQELILSLDCDGLDQSFMPAVSAPNHNGLSAQEMNEILKSCLSYWKATKSTPIFGLYEYNPVFDNIGTTAGRYLASLIHQFLYP